MTQQICSLQVDPDLPFEPGGSQSYIIQGVPTQVAKRGTSQKGKEKEKNVSDLSH